MNTFIQYILPALIGSISAVLGVWLSVRVQHKKIVEDDDASLRTALMTERKQLVKEIQDLQKRCDALEDENHRQANEMLELHTRNQQLINLAIKHFGSELF